MELSKNEVDEYYAPKDFQLGQTIKLQGHFFLLYDCDGFTKDYFQKNHPDMEVKSIEIPKKADKLQEHKKVRNKKNRCNLHYQLKGRFYVIVHIYIVHIYRIFHPTMDLDLLKTRFRIV